jgi:hypothetical protein
MKSILRRVGLLTGSFLVAGLIGCGPELPADGASPEPLASLETQADPLTVDPTIGATLPTMGGSGGTAFSDSCPVGYVGTGLGAINGTWLEQVQLICRKLNLDGTLGDTAYTPARGGGGGGAGFYSRSCADNQIMSGQVLGWDDGDNWVREMGALCSTSTHLKNATGGYDSTINPLGVNGLRYATSCPAGYAITGIYGRVSTLVDQLGFKCKKLDDVKSTVSINGNFSYQISNVSINGSTAPSTTLAAGQTFQLSLNYFAKDTCAGCIDQIIVGYVSSDPSVPQQPLKCVYNGSPGSTGISGSSSVSLQAPTQPGTYTLRVHYGQAYSCDLSWWSAGGTSGPEAIIGEIKVN